MRKLADEVLVKKAMDTLKGRARIKRTMWSRRAQEYVAKINSGDLISIAESYAISSAPRLSPNSYSERQLYEDALDRMARELAAVEKLDETWCRKRITDILSKSAKGRRLAESEAAVRPPHKGKANLARYKLTAPGSALPSEPGASFWGPGNRVMLRQEHGPVALPRACFVR